MFESNDWQVYSPSTLISANSEQQYIELALNHYQKTLLKHEKAMDYLTVTRGIGDVGIIDTFSVGFADRTLAHELPPLESYEGEMVRGLLQRHGLMKSNGPETFLGMLTLPMFSPENEMIGIYGHRISKYVSRDAPMSISVCSQPGVFYQHNVLSQCNEIVLCETPFDVLSLYGVGVSNAVALLSYKQFSPEHIQELKLHCISKVNIAFSRTPAGDRYYAIVKNALEKAGISTSKVKLNVGESISSTWAKSKLFEQLLAQLQTPIRQKKESKCLNHQFH